MYALIVILIGITMTITTFFLLPNPKAVKLGAWFIRLFSFTPIQIKGRLDPDAQMLLINHQSDLDIVAMETTTPHDLAWVAKKELFMIPYFGLIVRLPKHIALERESKTAIVKLIRECEDRLNHGRIITIFPEGTRTESGKMKPFKQGAKLVADRFGLKVQPVVLIRTAWHFSNKRKDYHPGTVTAVYLDPFIADKEDPDWLNNLHATMQKVYDDELANLSCHR